MKRAGINTARMQSIATNRGSVVSAVASLAARARLRPCARWVWMFSMVTVASSTRMPTANAKPPKDGPGHVRGLVELITDLNIVRQFGLEAWQAGFDGL